MARTNAEWKKGLLKMASCDHDWSYEMENGQIKSRTCGKCGRTEKLR